MTYITVNQALNHGLWQVKLPSLIVLALPLGTVFLAASMGVLPRNGPDALIWFGPVFLFSLLGSWLVWSIQIPRWRLWAYPKVESLEDLKEAAVANQLIWPEGSIFQKTELASKSVWEEIRRIEYSRTRDSDQADQQGGADGAD